MVRSIITGLLISILASCASNSVTNPNLLVPPIQLTRAEAYLDGGSIGGSLLDSRGQHLDFFFGLGFEHKGELYLGIVSGHPKPSMLARYDGWKAVDLYTLIERSIHEQFVWDAKTKALLPKTPPPKVKSDSFDCRFMHARALLRYVEKRLHRKISYMQ